MSHASATASHRFPSITCILWQQRAPAPFVNHFTSSSQYVLADYNRELLSASIYRMLKMAPLPTASSSLT